MNNLVIFPMLIPVVAGLIMIVFRHQITFQRVLSIISSIGIAGVTGALIHQVSNHGIQTIHLGGWEPPFGIVFVGDMFALILVFTTALVSIACLFYAFSSIGSKRESFYFYAFVQFLIAGVIGSFMTGDLFNLFVCFEVMLLASYVLISLGGEKIQLRESLKYVLINVLSSLLFLVSAGFLYGTVGTLNMAQLAERVASVEQTGILTTIAILFLIVFGLKSALFLFFWLPGSYGAPPTAVAALFGALLTKVGIYALFRTFTLIFPHEPGITHTLLGIMAGATMLLGGIGAIAYQDIKRIVSYNVVVAVGFIIAGLAIFSAPAIEGAIYYLIHDMIAKASLFLLAGTVIYLTGNAWLKNIGGLIRHFPVLGWTFFLVVLALAGIPPLSGFIGKVLVTQGAIMEGSYVLAAIALGSSILVLYSLLKIFKNSFWGETVMGKEEMMPLKKGMLLPCVYLAVLSIALGLGIEGISGYVTQAAETLMNPSIYIDAVLHNQ
ncbi:Na+/H+ antiporter subunit D [Alkalicoccobacillus murimartini]|uniref:Multicomponent Na+:H+ antiporter subunit D n=1 Tax=Alkalicoccobacillus murimartini TaxID=171685 RepID=A0ABT9YJW4_9BACI|nr:Na+/H+ antiporter subunit D [Alkalicoccobacillus murimartini]MDQ0207811.1 multicomponent Na+:H+ antiporter subunit D [Alkalicoccobacillus murimartini]